MFINDHISDLICRINNAQSSFLNFLELPHSKVKEAIVKVLLDEGYISAYKVNECDGIKSISINLSYYQGNPAIKLFKRVSKPGKRVYSSSKDLKKFKGGLGVVVVSTPKGILTDHQARAEKVGGEVICKIF